MPFKHIELLCGQYSIRIEGIPALVEILSAQWLDYQKAVYHPDVVLQIKEETFVCNELPTNGWSSKTSEIVQQAVYSSNKFPAFALTYRIQDLRSNVCVSIAKNRFLSLGILYGLILSLYQKCIGLHGVTVLCENEVIILSAASGTGKTTLAHLLEKYCDAIVINGDFALLTVTKEDVFFEPTPFCGTSGRALNHRFRVGRVVFLSQAKENKWHDLNGRDAMIRFMSNSFVPDWDREMTQTIQGNILKCIKAVKVNAYDFAPTQEAAEEFLAQIRER